MRRRIPKALVLAACLLAGLDCGGGEARRPNVLLVSIDTLRADHLSCYGYERATTPELARLAEDGVLFERAVSTTSWTLPAHLSMLTGLPISAHGACDDRLWDRKDAGGARIPPPLRGTFVSESLRAAGYATAGFYTWKYLDDQFGFGPGFDVWERVGYDFFSHPEVGARYLELKRAGDVEGMKALAAEHPELLDPAHRTSPEAIDHAIEWLDGRRSSEATQPFFLFVHLFDVHDPYLPPREYDHFGDPSYAGKIDGAHVTSPDSPVRGDMPTADLERLISLYDGGIAFVDAQVGRLLARLDELSLARDTLLIVTSDHGEEFFEHGQKTHRRQLYVESVEVPLILRWPARLPRGTRVAGTVGLIDLVPTILAAAGVPMSLALPGSDLLPLALRERANEPRPYSSLLYRFEGGKAIERQVGLFFGDEHALFSCSAGQPCGMRLYDLSRDPRERADPPVLAPADPAALPAEERIARLRASLAALRARLPDRGAELPVLSDLDKSQLAALGYSGATEASESEDASERLCLDGCVWESALEAPIIAPPDDH
jgi:arylsulfatase A-like enzyme